MGKSVRKITGVRKDVDGSVVDHILQENFVSKNASVRNAGWKAIKKDFVRRETTKKGTDGACDQNLQKIKSARCKADKYWRYFNDAVNGYSITFQVETVSNVLIISNGTE